jgi:antitoxin component YwqK of YwqJK toxin-antitoxin module
MVRLPNRLFKNGLPTSGFKILRENGTLMIEFILKNDMKCEVSKYTEDGILIDSLYGEIREFKGLY